MNSLHWYLIFQDLSFLKYVISGGDLLPKSLEDKTSRLSFPEEWAGLQDKELEEVSKIPGLRFCHTGRFIVSCNDLDCVYKVLDLLCK